MHLNLLKKTFLILFKLYRPKRSSLLSISPLTQLLYSTDLALSDF